MIKLHRERSSSVSTSTSPWLNDDDDQHHCIENSISPSEWESRVPKKRFSRDRRCSSTGNMREWTVDDIEDLSVDSWHKYHLRCFNVTSKGLVIRKGDIIRYRRIRSMSMVHQTKPVNPTGAIPNSPHLNTLSLPSEPWDRLSESSCSRRTSCTSEPETEEFTVYIVGSANVGKTALMNQFTTSEHILNSKSDVNQNSQVTVSMDSQETRLLFKEIRNIQPVPMPEDSGRPCAFVVVYSVTQSDSFLAATYILCQLKQSCWSNLVIVLVGNKSDLVRSRSVDKEEGQMVACTYKVKFIETSVGIHYNVDELLVGILRHLRTLNRKSRHRKSKCMERLSKARSSFKNMFSWMATRKDKSESHSCDIFRPS